MNNKKITHMLILMSSMFMALIIYLTVTDLYYRDEYTSSNFNTRNAVRETNTLRGTVFDRNGTKLAFTSETDGVLKRDYPYGNLYSHVIGYSSSTYGKSLVEAAYNNELLGKSDFISVSNIKNMISGEKKHGKNITLTIDHELQKRANALMGRYNGSVVALSPKTGEILAMVSKPDFNPDEDYLSKNWETLSDNENSPFLTRATMGLYPPGSTFKVLTTASMLDNGMENHVVDDSKGFINIGDKDISNAGKVYYGNTDLALGFKKSSNVFFADASMKMNSEMLQNTAESFMFNKKISIKFPYNKSKFNFGKMSEAERAVTGIGQGKTLVTPLHLALIAGAVANDGKMMKPHIVADVFSGDFRTPSVKKSVMNECISFEHANEIKNLMAESVKSGTGTYAQIYGIEVCGKTGTAENEKTSDDPGKTHAVFIGFAPKDNPEIAVSVVLEYAGSSGGAIAAPVAREVMKKFFELNK